jgi:hypothetical protein
LIAVALSLNSLPVQMMVSLPRFSSGMSFNEIVIESMDEQVPLFSFNQYIPEVET